MKRYTDLLADELAVLTDEQIRRFIEIETAFAAIMPCEVPVEPTLEAEGITASVIGFKVGELVFLDEKDAQAVAALPAMKDTYEYGISYNHRFLEPCSLKVEKSSFYRKEDVLRIAAGLKENENRRTRYGQEKNNYDKYLREITEISNNVWNTVREAKDRKERFQAAMRAYQKYLKLADGDSKIAEKFFRDAFKVHEELMKSVLDQVNTQPTSQEPETKGE